MAISYLYVGVLEQSDMQKGGFQRMQVGNVSFLIYCCSFGLK